MNYCNSNLEHHIRDKHFDELNALPPLKRFVRKFRLLLETLRPELRPGDKLFGWFMFDGEPVLKRLFDDEIPSPDVQAVMDLPKAFGSRTTVDKGHTLVDYGEILTHGLAWYDEKIAKGLTDYPDDPMLYAMRETLTLVRAFYNRLVEVAERTDKEIAAMLRQVPFGPARTFREGLQAVWLIHFLLPLAENAWYSISLGRMDQWLYPLYQTSIRDGMTRDEAKGMLRQFYELLNSYADGACLLNVGGDYNELSHLLIECQKEFGLPAPILGARVAEDTPAEVLESLIDPRLFTMGQPTFYGEEACVRALVTKGIPPREAKGFSNNSCMGISLAGAEFNSMWGCVMMIPAMLEAALNGGRVGDVVIPGIDPVTSTVEIFDRFEKAAEWCLQKAAASYEARAIHSEAHDPDPFVSILTKGCIEGRRDRISGALYHNVTVECMGMVNAADGIYAIDRLVFRDGKYTLNDFNRAVKVNFVGYEALRRDILACSRFGQNGEADLFAVRLAEILSRKIGELDHDNMIFVPSLHTLNVNVGDGRNWHASHDGRMEGEPFAKNAGPTNLARGSDPTNLVLSASKLPQHLFYGGQPIDVNFPLDTVANKKEAIASLVRVYHNRGGLQFQVNALSSALLRDAMEYPESYPDLVVRIGGYSIYFHRISKSAQLDFIERCEADGC